MSEGRTSVWQPRNVTTIPATIRPLSQMPLDGTRKRRVAAYARVSTDSEEQQTSYEAQVDYYTRYITGKQDEWEYVRVYTDEGISATNTKRRDGFNRMVQDALDGKIDLIITKSVSRFARNTVDSLTTVRQLKEKGVEVFFEKENIYTLDSKGELLITIMSSLAQEESRSISQNVSWGLHKRFSDGKVSLPYRRFLGYQKGADGYPEIVEEEAQVVRRIFGMYLDGMTVQDIAGVLEREGIPAPAGGRGWHRSTVRSILGNEKYAGNAVLQKTYVEDFLTKKVRVNKGEIPKYYVENSHPAIIPEAVYRLACQEREKRQGLGAKFSGQYSLSSKVVCGECGGYYGRKVWHAGSEYAQTVWHCNNRFAERTYCGTPTVKEEMIQRAFVEMINAQLIDRAHVAQGLRRALREALDMEKSRTEMARYSEKCDEVIEELREMLREAGRGQWTNEELEEKRKECIERHNAYKERLEQATATLEKQQKRADQIEVSIREMEERGLLTGFDAGLWNATVEKVVVESDTLLTFNLKDGRVVPWPFTPGVRTNRREGKGQ